MLATTLRHASVAAARHAVVGAPWRSAFLKAVASQIPCDAGVSLVEWWRTSGRFRFEASPDAPQYPVVPDPTPYALAHPTLRRLSDPSAAPVHRVSDDVDLEDYWRTPEYLNFLGLVNGRYALAVRLHADEEYLAFVGLLRISHDFTDGDVARLDQVREPLGSALRFRQALDLAAGVPPQHPTLATLSARERQVLALVSLGWTDAHIGKRLSISVRTAQKHVLNAREKLGAESRAEAAAWWVRWGDDAEVG